MPSTKAANPRITLDKELSTKGLEQKFCLLLKAALISLGYTIAVPEPDSGEDLWIGTPTREITNPGVRTIYRAQAKGVFSFEETKDKKTRRYDVNDYVTTVDYAITQPSFVYCVGIRDERLEEQTGNNFHIGCIPTQGFLNHIRDKYPEAGTNLKDRFGMQFVVKANPDHAKDAQILVNIRRAQNFDVTPYFKDLELGLRVSNGQASAPKCLEPVPGRRSPA